MKTLQPKFIVGIGGSAGALNGYKALLNTMPPDMGMAFVIISHMNPTANSLLAKILQRHTQMSVTVASEGMVILANHVYVIPPDSDLTMDNYRFNVTSPRISRNKQVDLFFISLANEMGAGAVGIVLSGYDGDGTVGCKHIKANGGTTFAQDLSVEVDSMSLSAQASGFVDFVLPLNKIPDKLLLLSASSQTTEPIIFISKDET